MKYSGFEGRLLTSGIVPQDRRPNHYVFENNEYARVAAEMLGVGGWRAGHKPGQHVGVSLLIATSTSRAKCSTPQVLLLPHVVNGFQNL